MRQLLIERFILYSHVPEKRSKSRSKIHDNLEEIYVSSSNIKIGERNVVSPNFEQLASRVHVAEKERFTEARPKIHSKTQNKSTSLLIVN